MAIEEVVWHIGEDHYFECPIQKGKDLGLDVIIPGPNDIQLDLDNPSLDNSTLDRAISILNSNGVPVSIVKRLPSKSGIGEHVYLSWPKPLTELERLLLQACLGSDRVRELLGYFRHLRGIEPVSCLFEKPEEKKEGYIDTGAIGWDCSI